MTTLTVQTELEFRKCGHSGSCPCGTDVYEVHVTGDVFPGKDEWEIKVADVSGLPGWLDWSELDSDSMETVVSALQHEAEKREARRQALPQELKRVANSIRRILEAPSPTSAERLGALTFALRKAVEEIDSLTRDSLTKGE